MIFIETKLKGAFIIDLERREDTRGFFGRAFCQNGFRAHGLKPVIVQANIASNIKKGTVRGMHFQFPPAAETKLVRCTRGGILDIIVDLRPESATFLQCVAVELNEENQRALYVPERFAHGYQTLCDNTDTSYQVGLGSLTSDRLQLDTRGKLVVWGGVIVSYVVALEQFLPALLQSTTDQERMVRIGVSLMAIMPLGLLLGFAFPTGMRLVEGVDRGPTPWFWGINGATGVLASVLGLMLSMSFGINATLLVSAACYLLLIPTSFVLLRLEHANRLGLVGK